PSPTSLPPLSLPRRSSDLLSWLYTWNEFLFALILTGSRTPMLTVRMAQFVNETGIEWHLMAATAVMAIGPALVVTIFAQEYVVRSEEHTSELQSLRHLVCR